MLWVKMLMLTPFSRAWQQRVLLTQLTVRDLRGRYRGSAAGIAWAFLTPLLMLAVYTFVFSVVFRARWGGVDSGTTSFAVNMFAGIIVHQFFAECINRAPRLIVDNPNYVKRVVFPLDLLAWSTLGSALIHGAIGLGILLAFQLLVTGKLALTAPLVIFVLAPLVLFTLGISWFLASLGVYLRDIAQVTGTLTTILLFLSPVFYPASALPPVFRAAMYLNPLTYAIEQTRLVMVEGAPPDWQVLLLATLIGWVAATAGFEWFQRTKGGFADVL